MRYGRWGISKYPSHVGIFLLLHITLLWSISYTSIIYNPIEEQTSTGRGIIIIIEKEEEEKEQADTTGQGGRMDERNVRTTTEGKEG